MATGDLLAQDRQAEPIALRQADWLPRSHVCVAAIIAMLLLGAAGCGNGPASGGLWPFGPNNDPPPESPAAATYSDIAEWQKGLQDGNSAGVIEQTKYFLRQYPHDPEGLLYLGLALIAYGDAKSANDPLTYLYEHGEFPEERSYHDTLLLYRGLMIVYAETDRPTEAEYFFKKAVELRPSQEHIFRYEYENHTLSLGDVP